MGSSQCDQILRNFTTLAKVYMCLANFWRFISYLEKCWAYFVQICDIIGLIFIVANGQILAKYSNHLVTLEAGNASIFKRIIV